MGLGYANCFVDFIEHVNHASLVSSFEGKKHRFFFEGGGGGSGMVLKGTLEN